MYKQYKVDIDETLEWSIEHGGCLFDLIIKKARESLDMLEFDGNITLLIQGIHFVVEFESNEISGVNKHG